MQVRKEVRDRFAEYDYEADNKALEELLKKALEKPLREWGEFPIELLHVRGIPSSEQLHVLQH